MMHLQSCWMQLSVACSVSTSSVISSVPDNQSMKKTHCASSSYRVTPITGCRKSKTKSFQVFTAGIAVDVQKQLGHIRIAFQIHIHMLLPNKINRLIGCRGQTSRLEWDSPGLLGVRSGRDQRTWIRSQ